MKRACGGGEGWEDDPGVLSDAHESFPQAHAVRMMSGNHMRTACRGAHPLTVHAIEISSDVEELKPPLERHMARFFGARHSTQSH